MRRLSAGLAARNRSHPTRWRSSLTGVWACRVIRAFGETHKDAEKTTWRKLNVDINEKNKSAQLLRAGTIAHEGCAKSIRTKL